MSGNEKITVDLNADPSYDAPGNRLVKADQKWSMPDGNHGLIAHVTDKYVKILEARSGHEYAYVTHKDFWWWVDRHKVTLTHEVQK